MTYSFNLLD